MTKHEKIAFLYENFQGEWVATRAEVFDLLSRSQPLFCICGKLATGLHETHCRRFNTRVDSETIKRLEHLLKNSTNE
nr:MAG TPA: hypothetical protein [Caudoviricetes sp.]